MCLVFLEDFGCLDPTRPARLPVGPETVSLTDGQSRGDAVERDYQNESVADGALGGGGMGDMGGMEDLMGGMGGGKSGGPKLPF